MGREHTHEHEVIIESKWDRNSSHILPSLNQYLGNYSRSPKYGNTQKREMMEGIMFDIHRQLRGWQTENPVVIHFRFGESKGGQKRDRDNILTVALKVTLDALVRFHVIKDDKASYVLNFTHDFVYSERPFISFWIEEVEPEKADAMAKYMYDHELTQLYDTLLGGNNDED